MGVTLAPGLQLFGLMKPWWTLLLLLMLPFSAKGDLREDQRTAAEVDRAPEVRVKADVEVRALSGSVDPADLDDFAALAQKGVQDIERFTGVQRNRSQRIVIYVSPRVGISHTFPRYPASPQHEPRMFIESARVTQRSAPYLHELVHAIVGDGGAMWLEEGFASYVASSVAQQYGGYYAPVLSDANGGVDAQAHDVIATGGGRDAPEWFASQQPQFRSQNERRNFYVLSHSFTKFLARVFGTQRLVAMHRADDPRALARVSAQYEGRWMGEVGR